MAVTVRIPTPLQRFTGSQAKVAVEGDSVREALAQLEAQFPGIRERLYDEAGRLRRFVSVFLNDEDVRYLQGEDTPLADGDVLSIVPAIAGGRL